MGIVYSKPNQKMNQPYVAKYRASKPRSSRRVMMHRREPVCPFSSLSQVPSQAPSSPFSAFGALS